MSYNNLYQYQNQGQGGFAVNYFGLPNNYAEEYYNSPQDNAEEEDDWEDADEYETGSYSVHKQGDSNFSFLHDKLKSAIVSMENEEEEYTESDDLKNAGSSLTSLDSNDSDKSRYSEDSDKSLYSGDSDQSQYSAESFESKDSSESVQSQKSKKSKQSRQPSRSCSDRNRRSSSMSELVHQQAKGEGLKEHATQSDMAKEKKRYSIKMVLSISIPVISLMAVCIFPFLNSVRDYISVSNSERTLQEGLVLTNLLHLLQVENGLSGLYLANSDNNEGKQNLISTFEEVDAELLKSYRATGVKFDVYFERDGVQKKLSEHRETILSEATSLEGSLAVYKQINQGVIKAIQKRLVGSTVKVHWKLYAALMSVLRALDAVSLQGPIGAYYFTTCQISDYGRNFISELSGAVNSQLEIGAVYTNTNYSSFKRVYADVISRVSNGVDKVIDNDCQASNSFQQYERGKAFVDDINAYRSVIIDWQNSVVAELLYEEDLTVYTFIKRFHLITTILAVAILGSVLAVLFYLVTFSAIVRKMQQLSKRAEDEKNKRKDLLLLMLPKCVARDLINNQKVTPQYFKMVTIGVTNIMGFMRITKGLKAKQTVAFLNGLFTAYDQTMENYDVYKVSTVGDSCMIVSGAPWKNGDYHASNIARLGLELIDVTYGFLVPHDDSLRIKIRIGMHSGPVVAGLVGLRLPQYCLFGYTINIANIMESYGKTMKIHLSRASKKLLLKIGGFGLKKRGAIDVVDEDGEEIVTYWLEE